jgi:hypothetical protein
VPFTKPHFAPDLSRGVGLEPIEIVATRAFVLGLTLGEASPTPRLKSGARLLHTWAYRGRAEIFALPARPVPNPNASVADLVSQNIPLP